MLLGVDEVVLDLVYDSSTYTALDAAVDNDNTEVAVLILEKLQEIRNRVDLECIYGQALMRAMQTHKGEIARLIAETNASALVKECTG